VQPRLLREPVRLAGLPLLRLQSDERLLRLAREGHPPAFAAIVDRYRPALHRYCMRLVGEQRAEDAVQQAFANAHRAMTERDDAIELRPWLYRIAHNAALNTLRGETAGWSLDDPDAPADLVALGGAADDVESHVVRRERLHDTLAAISSLPARQRDALVLRELEGRSHVEIADLLGVTAGAARQHLMRARAAVRAAATAVTPYPVLTKVSTWMTFTPTGERVTQVAAGAGLGAGLLKVSAGVMATGALVGGAVGTGVSLPGVHHASPTATAGRTTSPAAAVPVVSAQPVGIPARGVPARVSGSSARGNARNPVSTPTKTADQGSGGRSRAPAAASEDDEDRTDDHGAAGLTAPAGSPSRHGSGSDDEPDAPETTASSPTSGPKHSSGTGSSGGGSGDRDPVKPSDDDDDEDDDDRTGTTAVTTTALSGRPVEAAEPETPEPPEPERSGSGSGSGKVVPASSTGTGKSSTPVLDDDHSEKE
jgi:RNA polymerase sigma factor (sigma-70 family)